MGLVSLGDLLVCCFSSSPSLLVFFFCDLKMLTYVNCVNIFDVCCLFFPFPEHHSSFALFWTRFLLLTLLLSLSAVGYSAAIGFF